MTSSDSSRTERGSAVRAVLDEIYTAWADNDADAFVAPYAEDATATLPGTHLEGREAVRAAMAEVFAGPLKGSRGIHEVHDIRFPVAGTAVVTGRAAIVLAGESEPRGENRALDTWVLCEQEGAWRVQAFHNCPQNAG
jgi:uncharacterized protein (TIGR02246 family)